MHQFQVRSHSVRLQIYALLHVLCWFFFPSFFLVKITHYHGILLPIKHFRFCQPQIVKAYITLLADFKNNSQHTNHCIVKMLHRIAFDMGVIGMLFQASLFRIFQRILTDPVCNLKHFEASACQQLDRSSEMFSVFTVVIF